MKLSYEDRILSETAEWIHTNDLVRRVKGDKTGIIDAIHRLTKEEYLETKKESNRIFYKRNDEISSNENFKRSLKVHQWNYDQLLKALEKIPQLSTKKGKLTIKSKPIIKHLEYLMDRDSILMVRVNYQKNLGIISKKMAYQRIEMINELVSQVMKKISVKYESEMKLVRELFQDHSKELKFKI